MTTQLFMIFETDNIYINKKNKYTEKSNLLRVELFHIKVGNLTFSIRSFSFHSIHSLYLGKQAEYTKQIK